MPFSDIRHLADWQGRKTFRTKVKHPSNLFRYAFFKTPFNFKLKNVLFCNFSVPFSMILIMMAVRITVTITMYIISAKTEAARFSDLPDENTRLNRVTFHKTSIFNSYIFLFVKLKSGSQRNTQLPCVARGPQVSHT